MFERGLQRGDQRRTQLLPWAAPRAHELLVDFELDADVDVVRVDASQTKGQAIALAQIGVVATRS